MTDAELEKSGEEYWNNDVRRFYTDRLGQIDKALHKESGENLEQVKQVFIEAYKNRMRRKGLPPILGHHPWRDAWDDTNEFMTAYLGGGGASFSNGSADPALLQDIGKTKGLVTAYNMWAQSNDTKNKKPGNTAAQDESRAGIGADGEVGRNTEKETREAQAEAFMKGQEETARYEKKTGVTIAPDKTLSGYADAVEQARIVNQITGITVAPENSKAVKQAVKKLVNDGNYADARSCKQAAVNIESIWKKNSGTTAGDKIYPLYRYVSGILDFSWFETKQTFGKSEEDELKKLYKSIEKRYSSMGGMSPSEKMRLLKDISDAYGKEWAWYESLGDDDDAAVHNSESRQGREKDDKGGYRGMWVNGTVNALDGLLDLSTSLLTVNAYLSTQPWPASDRVSDESDMTWKQLFEGLKEYFTTPTTESTIEEARRRASDRYIKDADRAGIGPQGDVLPENTEEPEKRTLGEKGLDAVTAAGKGVLHGEGLLDIGKDAVDAWRGKGK